MPMHIYAQIKPEPLLLFLTLYRTLLRIGTQAAMQLVPRLAVYAIFGARAPDTFLDLL